MLNHGTSTLSITAVLVLQEAEEQLDAGKAGFVEASALTHKQVLEMAVAEASRRVLEATKYASRISTSL